MEAGQRVRVEVSVLDPGSSQTGLRPSPELGCSVPAGVGAYRPVAHVWSPIGMSSESSTWFCSRCRRIEKRTVVVEPLCLVCGHPLAEHVGGCHCGCRETVIVEEG